MVTKFFLQEFKHAIDLLKDAYFNDTSSADAIKRGNIGLLSDLNFGYGILKAARYQVMANNKEIPKNTYILRFGSFECQCFVMIILFVTSLSICSN